jgi:hypothetical protein
MKIFVLIGVLFAAMALQGCATVTRSAQGAREGFKEDWKQLSEADAWMQENMW